MSGFELPMLNFQFPMSWFQFPMLCFYYPMSCFKLPMSCFQFPMSAFHFPMFFLLSTLSLFVDFYHFLFPVILRLPSAVLRWECPRLIPAVPWGRPRRTRRSPRPTLFLGRWHIHSVFFPLFDLVDQQGLDGRSECSCGHVRDDLWSLETWTGWVPEP